MSLEIIPESLLLAATVVLESKRTLEMIDKGTFLSHVAAATGTEAWERVCS